MQCTNIAVIYDNGLGIKKDKNAAIEWYKKASDFNAKLHNITQVGCIIMVKQLNKIILMR